MADQNGTITEEYMSKIKIEMLTNLDLTKQLVSLFDKSNSRLVFDMKGYNYRMLQHMSVKECLRMRKCLSEVYRRVMEMFLKYLKSKKDKS